LDYLDSPPGGAVCEGFAWALHLGDGVYLEHSSSVSQYALNFLVLTKPSWVLSASAETSPVVPQISIWEWYCPDDYPHSFSQAFVLINKI
jgi:hypothetical protein